MSIAPIAYNLSCVVTTRCLNTSNSRTTPPPSQSYLDDELTYFIRHRKKSRFFSRTSLLGSESSHSTEKGVTFAQFSAMMEHIRDPHLLKDLHKLKENWAEKYLSGSYMISPR